MIKIVNYGLGNVNAFFNLYKRLNIDVEIAGKAEELEDASKIILPGVGSFDAAIQKLEINGLRNCLDYLVIEKKIPVLGICVGMQIMGMQSEEGSQAGLGWIDSSIIKFDDRNQLKLPHMGWNSINFMKDSFLSNNIDSEKGFYFLHSYHFENTDVFDCLATSFYGSKFPCIIKKDNIYGIQCHPEKSHSNGISFLENFANHA